MPISRSIPRIFPALKTATPIAAPTLRYRLWWKCAQIGQRTAISGSKPVAQLFDRTRQREGEAARKSLVVYRGKVFRKRKPAINTTIGPFPPRHGLPNDRQDAWSTRALTDVLWKTDVPKFSLLWLSEPDLSQHENAPGSPTSLAAIRSSDDNLGKVVAALKAKNALTSTDLFVVSDHGFSTIDLAVDVAERLRAAGFNAVRARSDRPTTGEILVVTLGGSVAFYVADHDSNTIQRLIEFLQSSDFAGVIFTRSVSQGTFTFAQALIDTRDAPDVLVACRWNDQPNHFGVPGKIASRHRAHRRPGQSRQPESIRYAQYPARHGARFPSRLDGRNVRPAMSTSRPRFFLILGLEMPNECDGRPSRRSFFAKEPAPTSSHKLVEAHKGSLAPDAYPNESRQDHLLHGRQRRTHGHAGRENARARIARRQPNEALDGKAPHTPARSDRP